MINQENIPQEMEPNKPKSFIIFLLIALIFLCISIYLVGNYIEKSYFLNIAINDETCYNFTYLDDNFTRCNLTEINELRKEIGNCNSYLNMSCVVEKDCGFNGTDYNYTNCKYFAYESIKKEDITLEYLENNCNETKLDVYRCYNRYRVEVN